MSDRAAEKQASRDEDARRLADGEVSPEGLRRENGLFSSLRIVSAKIIDRHYKLPEAKR